MHNPVCYSRQRWAYPKDEDRNFVAAFFHLLTIILICTSVVQLNWFRIWGGHCTPYLSTNQFFGFGKFYATTPSQYHLKSGGLITSPSAYTIHYNTSSGSLACVTPDVVHLMHMLIVLSTLAMFSSSLGFWLDIVGPTKYSFKFIRKNALPSVATGAATVMVMGGRMTSRLQAELVVERGLAREACRGEPPMFMIITVIGTSYFVTRSFEESFYDMHIESDMQITYDYGCYVITAAGSFSILATACNLLQTQSIVEDPQRHTRLVEDWDGLETFSVGMRNMPHAPPPYTP